MRDLDRAGDDLRRRGAHEDHLGVQPQKQAGLLSVGLAVLTGRATADQIAELARLADVYGAGRVD